MPEIGFDPGSTDNPSRTHRAISFGYSGLPPHVARDYAELFVTQEQWDAIDALNPTYHHWYDEVKEILGDRCPAQGSGTYSVVIVNKTAWQNLIAETMKSPVPISLDRDVSRPMLFPESEIHWVVPFGSEVAQLEESESIEVIHDRSK